MYIIFLHKFPHFPDGTFTAKPEARALLTSSTLPKVVLEISENVIVFADSI